MSETKRVTVYRDKSPKREWRWRKVVSSDNVASSGEGYENKADAVEQAEKEAGDEFEVVVEDEGGE